MLRGESDKALQASLDAHDLPCPSAAVLKAIRDALAVPKGFAIGASNKTTIDYLTLRKLLEFASKTPAAQAAIDMVETPRVREIVEVATLVSVPNKELFAVLAHCHVTLSPESIALFRTTFFDCDMLTRVELHVLVVERVAVGVRRVIAADDDRGFRRAMANDPRITAVTADASLLAWQAVRMRAGVAPTRDELSIVVTVLQTAALVGAAEALFAGGYTAARDAVRFASVVQGARQVRDKIAASQGARNLVKNSRRDHDTRRVPTQTEPLASTGIGASDRRGGAPTSPSGARESPTGGQTGNPPIPAPPTTSSHGSSRANRPSQKASSHARARRHQS
jgi:hypothetical protein